MSSTQQPSLPEQKLDFFLKAGEDLTPAEGRDFAAFHIWEDEEEFQKVLYYWSSRFRAIHMAKLQTPIDAEFESSWQKYYAAEVVSFYLVGSDVI
jgi:hypothetical protein